MQPWTCENCGNEHDTPALITLLRCALCEEKRYLLPQRSATQETKSSQQSYASDDDDDDDDAYSFADSAADRDDGIEEDVKLAEQEFGPGAVIFTRLAGASAPQTLDLHLEPPKLLPCDVCTAWGLPARLQLRLAFENGAAYRCQRVDRLTLWHAGRGEKGEAVDAAADGCLVAQQLLRIVTTFWDALAAGQPLGVELPLSVGGEGGGGGEGGAIECDGGDDGAKLLAPTGKRLRRQDAGGSSSSDGSDGSGTAELLLPGMPRRQDSRATSQQAAHAHALPATATLSYVRDRLRSLNAYCAICDEPHPFGAMLQPTVCQRPLCSHQFSQFGEKIVGAASLATHAEVLDLLIATTTLAATSTRSELILSPFPTVAASRGSSELALDPDHPNRPLAAEVCRCFPAFERINAAAYGTAGESVRTLMDAHHPLCFALFEWILGSNRAHLVSVPERLKLGRLGTRHQFVMLSAPPERQAAFEALKAQHGSKFAWHGSGPENWHAILRTGLRNLSNTKLMTTGAAHGAGIYLSTSATMSMGYARMGHYANSKTYVENELQTARRHRQPSGCRIIGP